jgi:hypothetical protein
VKWPSPFFVVFDCFPALPNEFIGLQEPSGKTPFFIFDNRAGNAYIFLMKTHREIDRRGLIVIH